MVDSAPDAAEARAAHSRPVSPLNEHDDELPNYSTRDPNHIPLETRGHQHHDLSAHRNISIFSSRSLKHAVYSTAALVVLYILMEGVGWGLAVQLEGTPRFGSMTNYTDTHNGGYKIKPSDWQLNEQWITAAVVLCILAGMVSLPLTLCVVRVAAFVAVGENVAKTQIGVSTLWRRDKKWKSARIFSLVLYLIAVLILPLQLTLVEWKDGKGPGVFDTITGYFGYTIDDQSQLEAMRNAMSSEVRDTKSSGVWTLASTPLNGDSNNITNLLIKDHWVSAFDNATSTGFLKSIKLRTNSSVSCSVVADINEYDADCSKESDWRMLHNLSDPLYGATRYARNPLLSMDVCINTDTSNLAWSNAGNHQDLTEHLFIKTIVNDSYYGDTYTTSYRGDSPPSQTIHCVGTTSWGCFELPNYLNGNLPGPLRNPIKNGSNVRVDLNRACTYIDRLDKRDIAPITNDTRRGLGGSSQLSLFNSALVLFSNYTDLINDLGGLNPWLRWPQDLDGRSSIYSGATYSDYLYALASIRHLEHQLRLAMYLSNRQAISSDSHYLLPETSVDMGYDTKRLYSSRGKIIIISVLVGLQLSALGILAFGMLWVMRRRTLKSRKRIV